MTMVETMGDCHKTCFFLFAGQYRSQRVHWAVSSEAASACDRFFETGNIRNAWNPHSYQPNTNGQVIVI